MSVTMKMELLIPYGSTCLLPLSSSSSAKLAVSLGACRTHLACFTRTRWSDNTLTLPRSNTQYHKCVHVWKKHGRRVAFCLAFAAAAVPAVKDDKGNSETDVQITEIKEPNCRVRLNVKVPPRICKESYEQVLDELRKQTQIPGFRRGERIPDKILINFIGKQKIKTAAIEAVLNKTLPEAMSLVKDRALKDSEHIETKYNALQAAFSPSSFLSYDVAVDLAPEVKWTSPEAYKNLKVVVEVESDAAIERAAEAELKARHKNLGSLKIVQDRGVKIGDVVVLDVSATQINEAGTEGDKLPFTEQKGFHLDTEENTHLVPGFVNAILGLETGQMRSFQLVFPDTWKQKELQGVLSRFTVECKELFYRDLPVLDDTLADKLVNGCSSLSQVQESILQEHKQLAEAKKKQLIQRALLQELCQVVEMDIPHSLLEEHGRQLYGAKLIQLQITMKLTEDQILNLSSAKAVNNYLLSQKETIKESVKQTLSVEEIFNIENLQYSEEELEKEVEDTAAEFKSYNHEFDRDRIREQAQEFLKGEKVLQFLMQHADITYMLNDV